MKALHELKDMLEKEVGKMVAKDAITAQDVEVAYKVIDIIKDIDTIHAMEQYGDGDYSNTYRGGRSMDDGWSYRRGRDMRTGRYVSRDGGSYRGYSRGAARDRMMERLEEAMEDAGSESERHAIMRCMEKLED